MRTQGKSDLFILSYIVYFYYYCRSLWNSFLLPDACLSCFIACVFLLSPEVEQSAVSLYLPFFPLPPCILWVFIPSFLSFVKTYCTDTMRLASPFLFFLLTPFSLPLLWCICACVMVLQHAKKGWKLFPAFYEIHVTNYVARFIGSDWRQKNWDGLYCMQEPVYSQKCWRLRWTTFRCWVFSVSDLNICPSFLSWCDLPPLICHLIFKKASV